MLHDPLTGSTCRFAGPGRQTGGQLVEVEGLLDSGGRVPRRLYLRQDQRVQAWRERPASSLAAGEGATAIQLVHQLPNEAHGSGRLRMTLPYPCHATGLCQVGDVWLP